MAMCSRIWERLSMDSTFRDRNRRSRIEPD